MTSLSHTPSRSASTWLWIALVALIYTSMQLQFSLHHGRLVMPPMFDDVVYFEDAVERLDGIYSHGWWQCIHDYVANPPHSPYSSFMALGAFLVFGIRDWAPYAMNAIPLAVLLWCANWLMRGTKLWARVAGIVFVLAAPIAGFMITDCRPDVAWGLAAAMAVLTALKSPFLGASFKHHLGVGAWLAAALLIKPTMFPLTLLSVAIAWTLGCFCDWIDGRVAGWREIGSTWLRCSLPALLVAGPHYILNRHEIHDYTFHHAVNNRKAAVLAGDGSLQLNYFLYGSAGKMMFGQQMTLILLVLVLALTLLLIARRRGTVSAGRIVRVASMGAVAFVAFGVPSLVGLGNPYFGTEFHFLLLLGSLMAMRVILESELLGPVRWRPLVPIAATVAAVLLSKGFSVPTDSAGKFAGDYNRIVREVNAVLLKNAPVGSRVFFTGAGWLNSTTLMYLSHQADQPLLETDRAYSDKIADQVHGFDTSDFVVAAEPGVGEFYAYVPSWKLLDRCLQAIRARTDYRQLAAVQSETGKWIYVFERLPKFNGWEYAANLAPLEGPYHNLPVLRWGLYPWVATDYMAERPGAYHLSARFQPALEQQVMTINVDGKQVSGYAMKAVGMFDAMELPLTLSAGKHQIVLGFERYVDSKADPRKRAAMFERLQIVPPAPTSQPTTMPSGPLSRYSGGG